MIAREILQSLGRALSPAICGMQLHLMPIYPELRPLQLHLAVTRILSIADESTGHEERHSYRRSSNFSSTSLIDISSEASIRSLSFRAECPY